MACRDGVVLPVRNFSILMYCLKLTSRIQLKIQKIKTLNVLSSAIKNSPKMNEEMFGLSVSPVLCGHKWTVSDQRMQNMSVTFIIRLEAERVLPNLKSMIFIARINYIYEVWLVYSVVKTAYSILSDYFRLTSICKFF